MITIRKLESLETGTRLRKIARLLEGIEIDLVAGRDEDETWLSGLFALAERDLGISTVGESDPVRRSSALRHAIYERMGREIADWDLRPRTAPDAANPRERARFPIALYLEDIRSPFNVGSIFRAAEAFGVERCWLSPGTADPTHPRAQRSAMGCIEAIPWCRADLDQLPGDRPLFALETGGTDLRTFDWPERGIAIIGSEELGVSPRARKKSAGRIASITQYGDKGALNVGVAAGIMLHAWTDHICSRSES